MTQIGNTTERSGIRELTSEEIAVVAGGHLGGIAQVIACKIERVISCLSRIFCGNNQPPF
jgi:hypothetical protein